MSAGNGDNVWGSAVDQKSGRTYYYNIVTKETTWNKPLELATPEERVEILRKKKETLEFFKDMESNIMKKLRNEVEPEDKFGDWDLMDQLSQEGRKRVQSISYQGRVRTISSLDDSSLDFINAAAAASKQLAHQSRSEAKSEEKDAFENMTLTNIKQTSRGLRRRNSTGTVYVSSTMSAQDNAATIHCVCVVIRAHMLRAAREGIEPLRRYDIFKDSMYVNSGNNFRLGGADSKVSSDLNKVPSLQTVKEFFTMIFSKSQLESECIIIALIYCERLVKETRGRLCIRYDNWRSILFACLVMASKVWDDMSMWNVDFSQVCASFDLHRINELELAMLEELKYLIRVPASEYAKYYFHLRSMMTKHGFHESDLSRLQPLDMAGAKRLQIATEQFILNDQEEGTVRRRTKTLQGGDMVQYNDHEHHVSVGLEQLVHADHVDADGVAHTSTKMKSPRPGASSASPSKSQQQNSSQHYFPSCDADCKPVSQHVTGARSSKF